MKIKSIFTAAVAFTLGLTACNKEESMSQDGLPENAVRITASVGNPFAATRSNPVGTVEEQAKFNSGDKILVTKNSDNTKVIYQFNGTTWVPTENKHLLWTNEEDIFLADYPVNADGNKIEFAKSDQSTLENLAKSDLMFAEIENAPKGEPLNFVMERETRRIIVNIAGFNPEFSSDSKVTDVKMIAEYSGYIDTYTPYSTLVEGGKAGSSYTLLRDDYMDNLYVTLKVGEKEMRSSNLPSMNYGKSYTLNLIVGKEKLEIESVTVADWTGSVTLPVGEAGELG